MVVNKKIRMVMKKFICILFCVLFAGTGYSQVASDDFNISNEKPLSHTGLWGVWGYEAWSQAATPNVQGTNNGVQVVSNAIQAYNDVANGYYGGTFYRTTFTRNKRFEITITQTGGDSSATSVWLCLVKDTGSTSSNFNNANGYAVRYKLQSGTDVFRITSVYHGYPSNSTLVDKGYNIAPANVPATICFTLDSNKHVSAWVKGDSANSYCTYYDPPGSGTAMSSDSTSTMYFVIRAGVFTSPIIFDNFVVYSLSASPPSPPSTPTLATPSSGTIDQSITPTLAWNTATGATTYRLQVSTDAGFSTTAYDNAALTGTNQQVTGLANSTVYYWRVSATNTGGTSSWSSIWNFTTIAGAVNRCTSFPVVTFSFSPSSSIDTSMSVTISAHVTIASTCNKIDTVRLYLKNRDTLDVRCGNTKDTTVSLVLGKLSAGNYSGYAYGRDDSGHTTTTALSYISVGITSQFRGIVGYYAEGQSGLTSATNGDRLHPNDIDFTKVDVVNWFASQPDPTVSPYCRLITAADSVRLETLPNVPTSTAVDGMPRDAQNRPLWLQYVISKAHAAGKKVILDIGGNAGGSNADMDVIWASLATDTVKFNTWLNWNTGYLQRKNLDGFGLDWEYPGSSITSAMLKRGIQKIRLALDAVGTGKLLMWVASEGGPDKEDATVWNNCVDILFPMNYGYGKGGGKPVYHSTPIYGQPGCYSGWTIDTKGPKAFTALGFDKRRISITLAFEAYQSTTNLHLCEISTTNNRSFRSSKQAFDALAAYPNSYHWSDYAKAPYLEEAGGYFWSYDDSASFSEKINYGRTLELGWVAIWNLNLGQQNGEQVQLRKVKNIMGGVIPTDTIPAAPLLATPDSNSTNQQINNFTLKWHPSSRALSYRILIDAHSNFSFTDVDASSTDTTTYITTALQWDTKYYWKVQAINNQGASSFSYTWSFTTRSQYVNPPNTPGLVNPTANQTGITIPLTFKWNTVDTVTLGYTLQLVQTDSNNTNYVINQAGITDTQYTYSNSLQSGANYYWRVRAANAKGNSAYTSYRKFTTASAPLPTTINYKYFHVLDPKTNEPSRGYPNGLPMITGPSNQYKAGTTGISIFNFDPTSGQFWILMPDSTVWYIQATKRNY
jgi:GH18 family chitinase